ncbi:hypothetical protein sos41_42090 [Alphaproteobacteria bacterium SO-S41]|nr:hypothetical protein sos41_42090 [Alphaproteobacteria bacterium SO-S41]
MALKIRYVTGPLAGRELDFDDDKSQIHFGRGIDADVSFPDDLTLVSREHFGLRKEYGGYKFVINPEKPVFMNGRPLYDDQAVPKDAEIQLGSLEGPRLKLERIDGRGSNQAKTEILKPQRELAHDLHATSVKGNRTLGIVAAIAALVLVLGGLGWLITNSLKEDVVAVQGQVKDIQTDLPAVRKELANLSNSNIDAATIIAANKESVYYVQQLDAAGNVVGVATATSVLMPDGTKALATNAHVAEMFTELSTEPKLAGGKLIARQSKGLDHPFVEINAVRVHPGFDRFQEWVFLNDSRQKVMGGAANQDWNYYIPAYDVALLFVTEPDKLGPPAKLASRETMAALRAGDGLVYVGYPSEGVAGTNVMMPEPTAETGRITSLTTFFLTPGPVEQEQLVQHSVPSAGGASGSAIFNAKGEIVAFHNAGNMNFFKDTDGKVHRVGSTAMINYAQRADLMLDLMEGKVDAQMPQIEKQFAEADARLALTPEVQLKNIMDAMAHDAGGADKVKKVAEFEGMMAEAIPELNSPKNLIHGLEVPDAAQYVFVVQSDDNRPVQAGVVIDSRLVTSDGIAGVTYYSDKLAAHQQLIFVGSDFHAMLHPDDARPDGKLKVTLYELMR